MWPYFSWDHVNVGMAGGFVIAVSGVWIAVGLLKTRGLLVTGDARKINHATALAGGAIWFFGADDRVLRSTCQVATGILFGLLLLACWHRRLWPFKYAYVGYARESDQPHAAFHVWFSWFVSIAGLLLVDVAFGNLALTRVAALVLGVADAVAEPIGTRFGIHKFAVRDILTAAPRFRSWEGTGAVAIATFAVVLMTCGSIIPSGQLIPWALAAAGLIAIVEACTPHGFDNFTIPISAAWLLQTIVR